jgi:hypothetical protein
MISFIKSYVVENLLPKNPVIVLMAISAGRVVDNAVGI